MAGTASISSYAKLSYPVIQQSPPHHLAFMPYLSRPFSSDWTFPSSYYSNAFLILAYFEFFNFLYAAR